MSMSPEQPTRLAIVGADLKFIRPLISRFESSPLFEVKVDEWPKFREHDPIVTEKTLTWAETVVCEWAGPNAVIASRSKRPDQRLIVHLHRMELSHPEWRDINIDAVDLVITVGPHYRRRVLKTTGWPEDKVVVVPNFIDEAEFALPKLEGSRFRLGMIGFASARKGLDFALDILAEVRRHDQRFELFLKGPSPWGHKWVEDRPDELAFFAEIRKRLEEDPLVSEAVTFDPPGPDVGPWLQKIGFVLSTSDDESFHLSPAEGMASGAVPVIRPWPGADEIYDPDWVVDDPVAMAERILSIGGDEDLWRSLGECAQLEVLAKYRLDHVSQLWTSIALRPGDHRLRIGMVSRRNTSQDPEQRALITSLDSVGHEVSVIFSESLGVGLPQDVSVTSAEARLPRSLWKRLARRLRRLNASKGGQDEALLRAFAKAGPDIVYPHRAEDIALADRLGVPVLRQPEWPAPELDLVFLAPHRPELALPAGALSGEPCHIADWPASSRQPERHEGKSVAIAYRVTPTSPGRYLESALRRSGASVTVLNGVLDWDQVPADAAFVVVVESPYPALDVRGTEKGAPVFFWVHHGEHHLAANLRLTDRYSASAVLLAHSWHLAHRFPVPVHRFPFAVPEEFVDEPRPWFERSFDVAMVGAGIGGSGGRYNRRREIVKSLQADSSIRSKFAYGLPPEEMWALYGDARIVVNDGGPRHFPITMRVFEALGSGALLLTEDQPGTDVMLKRGRQYVPIEEDVVRQVRSLLQETTSAAIASDGHEWSLSRHTYAHRVDRLFELAAESSATGPQAHRASYPPLTPLAALIDRDVEVQQLAVFGQVDEMGLEDRAIRVGDAPHLAERSIDAVVIGAGLVEDLRTAVLAARGYVYSDKQHSAAIQEILAADRPEAEITLKSGLLSADIGGAHYQMRPADNPQSQ